MAAQLTNSEQTKPVKVEVPATSNRFPNSKDPNRKISYESFADLAKPAKTEKGDATYKPPTPCCNIL